jgi:hypothetical protein
MKQSLSGWLPKGFSDYPRTMISGAKEYNISFVSTPASGSGNYEINEGGGSPNPFIQRDLLKEENLQNLIFLIRMFKFLPSRETITKRLLELMNDAIEEKSLISIESLRNFYNFICSNPELKHPAISLSPDFFIYASWKGDQGKLFSVLFLPEGETRFVIFKPNDLHPEKKIRISGTVTADRLMETVKPHGILEWISE